MGVSSMDSYLTSPVATLLGAIIIGGAIVGAQFVPRYQIAAAVDTNGNPSLWRVEVRTGEIQRCNFAKLTQAPAAIDPKTGTVNPFDALVEGGSSFRFSCTKDITP